MPLADEYGKALQAKFDELSAGLGNDAQRELLRSSYDRMAGNLHAKALAHASGEFRSYRRETAQATVANRGNALANGWRDEADVVNDIARLYEVDRQTDAERYHALAENVQAMNDDLRLKLGREPSEQELLTEAKKMQAKKEIAIKAGWIWDDKEKALKMTAAEQRAADELKRKRETGK
ncbi:Uncharacterised protein [Kingella potus]|uniref:Uncharacterized protein n=2 Tax=Kingella potus TaxID=265175 RepID=A0A377R2R2_9NEIS|nr:Uncharacterised protein [Kingella potus]